ncbi:MAG: metallophosphoesterase family protein [Actinobacteria bacterium]|nr:metallophosphoesterase family protein [Actinomycetota bacterium]MBV9255156.1 metallophosphoesterase family protein [Actinomycetota bacterium]
MRLLVLADTHLRAGRSLPASVVAAVERADGVLHAGDVTEAELLDELAARKPLWAVLGNNDRTLSDRLPEVIEEIFDGVPVAMVHESGARKGREARLHRRFPDARVVVFGHSHEPVDVLGVGGQRLFNPGSPTQRRRQPVATFGWLKLERGRILEHRIVPVGG